jgi:membrane-bound ClpP family serine protease
VYADRKKFYKQLEKARNSKVISYITGDRRALSYSISREDVDIFSDHLDALGPTEKISLYLYTCGGDLSAAWTIVNLLRQYCKELEIIIPRKAWSAGTLIALGGDNIVMTRNSFLGPIDPSINTPLNPQYNNGMSLVPVKVPVSVEDVNSYMNDFVKKSKPKSMDSIITSFASYVHPLVIGHVYRSIDQIRFLASSLLTNNKKLNKKQKDKIINFLCREAGSHDYSICLSEAKEKLRLNIEEADSDSYAPIKSIYNDIREELELLRPFNTNDIPNGKYTFRIALIESIGEGSHAFTLEGELKRSQSINPQTNQQQEIITDKNSFRGWKK